MNKYPDLMIDIETLSTDSYSVILSLAAVEFNIETGKLGKHFYRAIDIQSCLDLGLVVSGKTILWWLAQTDEAKADLIKLEKFNILDVLYEFSALCKKDYKVWSNSARFDLGIIGDAYRKAKLPIPWEYQNERCVRTLYSLKPHLKATYNHTGVDHNALSDCYKQIKICSLIWGSLANQKLL